MFDGLNLKKHFDDNNYFAIKDELIIIDDYNILGISNERSNYLIANNENISAQDFYINNFKDSNCKTIKIYFQYRKPIEYRGQRTPINIAIRRAFLSFVKMPYNINIQEADQKYIDGKINAFEKAIDFMNEMKSKCGIQIKLCGYNAIHAHPPFHGRYWLNIEHTKEKNNINDRWEGHGLLVDGSLNTTGNKKVLAQELDDENFDIVCDFFYNEISTKRDIIEFDSEQLMDMGNIIFGL